MAAFVLAYVTLPAQTASVTRYRLSRPHTKMWESCQLGVETWASTAQCDRLNIRL